MTTYNLVKQIELLGGQFVIDGRQVSLLWPVFGKRSSKNQRNFQRLAKAVRENHYCVTAWILDRQAGRLYEKFGPNWWREPRPELPLEPARESPNRKGEETTTIQEAIRNLQWIQQAMAKLKTTHPQAAIRAGVRKGHFGFTAFENAGRGTVSIEQIEANVQNLIQRLEETRTAHPDADGMPKAAKKQFSFVTILGSTSDGLAGTTEGGTEYDADCTATSPEPPAGAR